MLALAWLFVVGSLIILLAKQWVLQSPLETNILKLLPKNEQNPVAEQAFEAVASNIDNTVVFVLTGALKNTLYLAAEELSESLKQSGYFSEVRGKMTADKQTLWSQHYFKYRHQQLTPKQRERLAKEPFTQTQEVIQKLYSPFSGATSQELKNDPFLLFRDYLSFLTQRTPGFTLHNGFLSLERGGETYILITATLNHSPYYLAAQKTVADISSLNKYLEKTYRVKIYNTGVLFYAEFGIRSAKTEITTIGLFSLLGIVVLFVAVFRSLSPMLLAMLSVFVGIIAALSITTLVYGKIHLFSLVFGASLIGVSIDYAFHFLTERLASGLNWDSRKGLRYIFPAITMGLVTSLIGYTGMLAAPFPGLQQLALFSSVGLIAAYITVVAWYPLLLVKPCSSRALPGAAFWQRWLSLWSKPHVKVLLPLIVAVLAAVAFIQVQYDDDIHQLQAIPAQLKKQEQFIARLSGMQPSPQMLVVSAQDDESLLAELESLESLLHQWQQDGVIRDAQNLSEYISSIQRQKSDFALISQLYQKQGPVLQQALRLTQPPEIKRPLHPLTLQEFLAKEVSVPVRFLYLGEVEGMKASVVLLNGLSDPEAVKAMAVKNPSIIYLDKAEDISELFANYRSTVLKLLLLAASIILVLLIKKYGFTHAVLILLPSLIACLAGLAVVSLLGTALNLFNLLALILIIGIGIDYTLFFAENAHSQSTLLAVTLSAVTTLLSFGLLSLSQTNAIHSFGITVLSGIFIAWLLSPLAINADKEK